MGTAVTRPVALSSITEREAQVLLQTLARVKEMKFGRLVVEVSGGCIVAVEIVQKVDRNLLAAASTSTSGGPDTEEATDLAME